MTSETKRVWWALGCEYTERDLHYMRQFNVWGLLWAVGWVAASMVLGDEGGAVSPTGVAIALLPTFLGLGMVRAFLLFLRQTDELQRKIHVEALALSFGATAVFLVGYRLLERAGAPIIDTADPLMFMALVWAFSQWLMVRRYA